MSRNEGFRTELHLHSGRLAARASCSVEPYEVGEEQDRQRVDVSSLLISRLPRLVRGRMFGVGPAPRVRNADAVVRRLRSEAGAAVEFTGLAPVKVGTSNDEFLVFHCLGDPAPLAGVLTRPIKVMGAEVSCIPLIRSRTIKAEVRAGDLTNVKGDEIAQAVEDYEGIALRPTTQGVFEASTLNDAMLLCAPAWEISVRSGISLGFSAVWASVAVGAWLADLELPHAAVSLGPSPLTTMVPTPSLDAAPKASSPAAAPVTAPASLGPPLDSIRSALDSTSTAVEVAIIDLLRTHSRLAAAMIGSRLREQALEAPKSLRAFIRGMIQRGAPIAEVPTPNGFDAMFAFNDSVARASSAQADGLAAPPLGISRHAPAAPLSSSAPTPSSNDSNSNVPASTLAARVTVQQPELPLDSTSTTAEAAIVELLQAHGRLNAAALGKLLHARGLKAPEGLQAFIRRIVQRGGTSILEERRGAEAVFSCDGALPRGASLQVDAHMSQVAETAAPALSATSPQLPAMPTTVPSGGSNLVAPTGTPSAALQQSELPLDSTAATVEAAIVELLRTHGRLTVVALGRHLSSQSLKTPGNLNTFIRGMMRRGSPIAEDPNGSASNQAYSFDDSVAQVPSSQVDAPLPPAATAAAPSLAATLCAPVLLLPLVAPTERTDGSKLAAPASTLRAAALVQPSVLPQQLVAADDFDSTPSSAVEAAIVAFLRTVSCSNTVAIETHLRSWGLKAPRGLLQSFIGGMKDRGAPIVESWRGPDVLYSFDGFSSRSALSQVEAEFHHGARASGSPWPEKPPVFHKPTVLRMRDDATRLGVCQRHILNRECFCEPGDDFLHVDTQAIGLMKRMCVRLGRDTFSGLCVPFLLAGRREGPASPACACGGPDVNCMFRLNGVEEAHPGAAVRSPSVFDDFVARATTSRELQAPSVRARTASGGGSGAGGSATSVPGPHGPSPHHRPALAEFASGDVRSAEQACPPAAARATGSSRAMTASHHRDVDSRDSEMESATLLGVSSDAAERKTAAAPDTETAAVCPDDIILEYIRSGGSSGRSHDAVIAYLHSRGLGISPSLSEHIKGMISRGVPLRVISEFLPGSNSLSATMWYKVAAKKLSASCAPVPGPGDVVVASMSDASGSRAPAAAVHDAILAYVRSGGHRGRSSRDVATYLASQNIAAIPSLHHVVQEMLLDRRGAPLEVDGDISSGDVWYRPAKVAAVKRAMVSTESALQDARAGPCGAQAQPSGLLGNALQEVPTSSHPPERLAVELSVPVPSAASLSEASGAAARGVELDAETSTMIADFIRDAGAEGRSGEEISAALRSRNLVLPSSLALYVRTMIKRGAPISLSLGLGSATRYKTTTMPTFVATLPGAVAFTAWHVPVATANSTHPRPLCL